MTSSCLFLNEFAEQPYPAGRLTLSCALLSPRGKSCRLLGVRGTGVRPWEVTASEATTLQTRGPGTETGSGSGGSRTWGGAGNVWATLAGTEAPWGCPEGWSVWPGTCRDPGLRPQGPGPRGHPRLTASLPASQPTQSPAPPCGGHPWAQTGRAPASTAHDCPTRQHSRPPLVPRPSPTVA